MKGKEEEQTHQFHGILSPMSTSGQRRKLSKNPNNSKLPSVLASPHNEEETKGKGVAPVVSQSAEFSKGSLNPSHEGEMRRDQSMSSHSTKKSKRLIFPAGMKPMSPSQKASVRPLQAVNFNAGSFKVKRATAKLTMSDSIDKQKITKMEADKHPQKITEDGFDVQKPPNDAPIGEHSFLKNVKSVPQVEYVQLESLMFGPNPPPINPDTLVLQNHDSTKCSVRRNGIIRAYGANTNQGIIRDYNEDRVSIILNIMQPDNKSHIKNWPQ